MLADDWQSIVLLSFILVVLANGVLASCTTLYYNKSTWGRLSHSQLRIKQGNATFEHRLNVFASSILFSFVNPKIYLATAAMCLVLNFLFAMS
ncbi:MAG: hypothetical protein GY797_21530 [Deltaproteobacteria bacterium]|nr:hypothetical protein [Desulfobulbaceae bacterium]MCP4370668.1 hypothetical protein [Deltaproteobacteria bacterium]